MAEVENDRPVALALGELVFRFSDLESSLGFHISELLFASQKYEVEGRIVTSSMGFAAQVRLFERLFGHRFPDEARSKDLRQLVKKLRDANQLRNRILHNEYYMAYEDSPSVTTFEQQKFGESISPTTYEDVAAAASVIAKARKSLTHFILNWDKKIRDLSI